MTYCEQAFTDFCDWHWPCAYRKRNNHCANVYFGHAKGHQNAAGKVLATGRYIPSFRYHDDLSKWIQTLKRDLKKSQAFKNDARLGFNIEQDTCAQHIKNMRIFYQWVRSDSDFRNHHTCFCCLRDTPVHPLTCGHVLCDACVHSYGVPKGTRSIEMLDCPLCQAHNLKSPTSIINFMPPFAGVRVLSLDG